jgi:transcriptional regulator with GAF, ATPase, and Fis domain
VKTTADIGTLGLVGNSPAFLGVLRQVATLARVDAPVLIEGETGTGKEAVARAIHYLGARHEKAFVPINCGAIPDSLIESELFGHDRGPSLTRRKRVQA